jgi:hypothetical protein
MQAAGMTLWRPLKTLMGLSEMGDAIDMVMIQVKLDFTTYRL